MPGTDVWDFYSEFSEHRDKLTDVQAAVLAMIYEASIRSSAVDPERQPLCRRGALRFPEHFRSTRVSDVSLDRGEAEPAPRWSAKRLPHGTPALHRRA